MNLFLTRWRGCAFFDYTAAIAAVLLVLVVKLALQPLLAGRASFTLFSLAVMIAAFLGGRRAGIFATAISSIAGLYLIMQPSEAQPVTHHSHAAQVILFLGVGLGISFLTGALTAARRIAEARAAEARRAWEVANRRAEEARAALERVRVLSGLLPICASCKKIRDGRGHWEQLESYLHSHSNATFSHGLCPECAREFESQIL
jgi:K+-sensing histidine kinase KdpD